MRGNTHEGAAVKLITVRVPTELKDAVDSAAHDHRVSLNTYCVRALEASLEPGIKGFSNAAKHDPAREAQKRRT